MTLHVGSDKIKDTGTYGVYFCPGKTNCLTYTPKNVNLTLSNGILTLKAGGKVYVPNGKNSDGSLKFDEVVIERDVVNTDIGNSTTDLFILDIGINTISGFPNTICFSGDTAPTITGWALWYDTANNLMKYKDDTSSWITVAASLPFCKGTWSSSTLTSIDQIFDWCGYIGSTAFVLPGVKGLIPNGFNTDGIYKNIEFETDRVLTFTDSLVNRPAKLWIDDKTLYVWGSDNNNVRYLDTRPSVAPNTWCRAYIKNENKWLLATDTTTWIEESKICEAGEIFMDSNSKITSLTPYSVKTTNDLQTVNAIYNGSQCVYQYIPYNIGQVLLYGANTGAKTYTLPKGQYQCCVVGGGWSNQSNWSLASGAAAEIVFKLTAPATVVVYSGGLGATGYLNINGARIVTANTASGEMVGGTYSINTSSPYYVRTVMASNGNNANMSVGASVSPYENWGGGHDAGGARLAFVGR